MTQQNGSVSFDRAADFYDQTRVLAPETAEAQTAVLLGALDGVDGPVLEVGVGTGRVALPLAAAGVPVLGLDLSPAMLARLLAKGGDSVPVACADAVALPLGDGTVGAVLVAHVLHLVADWRAVVAEIERVLRPGGVLLATRGAQQTGVRAEIQARARASARWTQPPGRLDDLAPLDAHFAARGAQVDRLPEVGTHSDQSADQLLQSMQDNIYSWTWGFSDEQREGAVAAARAWVTTTYGDPASVVVGSAPIAWHRYRLPV